MLLITLGLDPDPVSVNPDHKHLDLDPNLDTNLIWSVDSIIIPDPEIPENGKNEELECAEELSGVPLVCSGTCISIKMSNKKFLMQQIFYSKSFVEKSLFWTGSET